METLEIIGIVGTIIGIITVIISLFTWVKRMIFKQNIEFHKILDSFPLISENRIKEGVKTDTSKGYTKASFSDDFTKFVESKKGELDIFLAKLEKFDTSKRMFKKKEISNFVQNLRIILSQKSADITFEGIINTKTNKIEETKINGFSFEWCAFNYWMLYQVIKERVDKLFVCKLLKL